MTINKNQAEKHSNDAENCKPYFYTIILSPQAQKSKLMIPKKFVKKYGRLLSDDIYINVPKSEQPWKMTLEKSNNNMFLGKGWQLLMELYSLDYGHFLLFRLDEGLPSQFHVHIFDMSATEIDYPVQNSDTNRSSTDIEQLVIRTCVKQENIEEDDDDDEDDVQIMDEVISPKFNNNVNILNTSYSSDCVQCSNSTDDIDCSTSWNDVEFSSSTDHVQCSSFKPKGEGCTTISPDMRKKLQKKLDGIKSQNPHFKLIMYPTYVRAQTKPHIPCRHASKYFPSNSKEIILEGPNGKRHRVRFYHGRQTTNLLGGWKNFVYDNDLKIGDLCMFELIHPHSYTYQVSIFRTDFITNSV